MKILFPIIVIIFALSVTACYQPTDPSEYSADIGNLVSEQKVSDFPELEGLAYSENDNVLGVYNLMPVVFGNNMLYVYACDPVKIAAYDKSNQEQILLDRAYFWYGMTFTVKTSQAVFFKQEICQIAYQNNPATERQLYYLETPYAVNRSNNYYSQKYIIFIINNINDIDSSIIKNAYAAVK